MLKFNFKLYIRNNTHVMLYKLRIIKFQWALFGKIKFKKFRHSLVMYIHSYSAAEH